MPESAAKRQVRVNHTAQSCSALGATAGGGTMADAGVPVIAASSRTQSAVRPGSTLSSANTAPDSTAAS